MALDDAGMPDDAGVENAPETYIDKRIGAFVQAF